MSRTLACWLGMLLSVPALSQPQPGLILDLFGSARAISVESQPSWLENGFGRLGTGAESSGDTRSEFLGDLRLGVKWRPSSHFAIVANGSIHAEPSRYRGEAAGLDEAFLEATLFRSDTALDAVFGRLRLRAGTFFLPTSRENIEPLWTSPYTITWSALNSWIGEEVRPLGLDADYRLDFPSGQSISVGGTVFRDNDTMGALLAWRGWAMHNRLTSWNEVLPLPPLESLSPTGIFKRQRSDGTIPFESDLDGRDGWSSRIRWSNRDRALIQWTRLDNRGDRGLYRGEYAWETSFDLIAAEFRPTIATVVAAEYMDGSTAMGPDGAVELDYKAWYLLASWHPSNWRLSARWDQFSTTDRDHNPRGEINDESSHAITIAGFWEPTPVIRLGLELVDMKADRAAALQSGFDPNTDGRSVTFEVRYYWGVTK